MQVQTLPTAQVTPALTDFFSWGYDPYTHACKARPPTTVGWTSLSVIVIVLVVTTPRTGGNDVWESAGHVARMGMGMGATLEASELLLTC